jgi:hypothetical protein
MEASRVGRDDLLRHSITRNAHSADTSPLEFAYESRGAEP